MIGRPFARNRWAIAGLAVTAGVALALACEAPTPTSERQVIKPNEASGLKTVTVAPLVKVDENCSPAYVLNGNKVDDQAIRALTPDQISSVEVYKGARAVQEAKALHLDAGCGVIKITTKSVAEGVDANRAQGAEDERALVRQYEDQQKAVADRPTFTPFTERPELKDKEAVAKALESYYPPLLRDAGIGGRAQVWFFISETGKVEKVQLNETSGYEALDQAALKVARSMAFTPARNKGKPVPVWVSIPLVFQAK